MTCAEVRERLLDADPAELEGRIDTPVSRHLAACPVCHARARRLLEAQEALEYVVAHVLPGARVDEAIHRAMRTREARRKRRAAWGAILPLAAAAGLAGVLVLGNGNGPVNGSGAAEVSEQRLPSFSVQPPAGQNVAVFHTDDPNIVVVWLY